MPVAFTYEQLQDLFISDNCYRIITLKYNLKPKIRA